MQELHAEEGAAAGGSEFPSAVPAQMRPESPGEFFWSRGFVGNRSELERRLGAPGGLDTKALIDRAVSRFGLSAPTQIEGSVSWVLREGNGRSIAVRDRTGIYPIYYCMSAGAPIFSSNLAGLLSRSSAALNEGAIAAHLCGEAPASGETFFRDLRMVEPGEIMVAKGSRIERSTYWKPCKLPCRTFTSDEEVFEEYCDLLLRVTSEYLPSGRCAVTLSSGLDSSSVAAAMCRASCSLHELLAICWSAPEIPEADESEATRNILVHLGLSAHMVRADLAWPLHREEGLRVPRSGPTLGFYRELWEETFRVAREAGVTALLSGLGGDHLFGGGAPPFADQLFSGKLAPAIRQLRAHRTASGLAWSIILRHHLIGPAVRGIIGRAPPRVRAPEWLGNRLAAGLPTLPKMPRDFSPGRSQRLLLFCDPRLASTAAAVTDQAARQGIDLRHPLLDRRLIEFAISLPADFAYRDGRRKWLVRQALKGWLPKETLERTEKILPTGIARRGLGELESKKVLELATNMRASDLGFIDEKRLRQTYEAYKCGGECDERFWHALSLEAWLRGRFSDRQDEDQNQSSR